MPYITTTDTSSPPAAVWVKFLRNYGPIPTNGNLFDEHVTKALVRARVRPVVLPTPRLEDMRRAVAVAGHSLLVAGTAGDGKTYHCRKLWDELGGAESDWMVPGTVKILDVDGRTTVFIKRLQEMAWLTLRLRKAKYLAVSGASVLLANSTNCYLATAAHLITSMSRVSFSCPSVLQRRSSLR